MPQPLPEFVTFEQAEQLCADHVLKYLNLFWHKLDLSWENRRQLTLMLMEAVKTSPLEYFAQHEKLQQAAPRDARCASDADAAVTAEVR